jgi:hypothetical protein
MRLDHETGIMKSIERSKILPAQVGLRGQGESHVEGRLSDIVVFIAMSVVSFRNNHSGVAYERAYLNMAIDPGENIMGILSSTGRPNHRFMRQRSIRP